ncbi:MAG: tetratricopeptide repeat protein [Verrucomicrobiota bacterium]
MSAPVQPLTRARDHASSRAKLWAALTICAAALVAYHNSFHGPFVFDDASSIETNLTIRQLWSLPGALATPTTNVTAQGRPMLNLSLALNYAVGGTSVVGYHVGNLLIHTLAGLTLFGLLRRTLLLGGLAAPATTTTATALGATPVALAIAVLWVVHPLQTESVTYIIQRAESLLGLFYLLTVYCFARAVKPGAGSDAPARGWLVLSVVACALGMATKEVMATAPLMVLFYDRTFVAPTFGAALRRRPGFYAALFGTWLLLGWLIAQGGGNRGGSVGFGAGVEPWAYWLTQLKAMAVYLRLTFWPAPLVFEYGTFWIERAGEIVFDALLVLGLLAVTLRGLVRRTALGFAGAWFFGILAPTSLAPGTTQMIVEHRMYLPLAVVLAVAVVAGRRLLAARSVWLGRVVIATAVVVALTLTVRRNVDYRTDIALWTDTIVKRPHNPLAHYMLAGAYERAGDVPRALASYEEALRLKPAFSVGHENYGQLLLKQGRRSEAIASFERALRLQPEYADAHANLGNALLADGQYGNAELHLAEAVRLAPMYPEAHYNYGNVLAAFGRHAEAAAQYETAVKLKPGAAVAEIHYNFGNSLVALRRVPEAIVQFRAALEVRSDYPVAHYNLANALAMSGQQAAAVPHYEAALRANPANVEARHNLGSAFFELGRLPEAAQQYEEALRLKSDIEGTREALEQVRARMRGR